MPIPFLSSINLTKNEVENFKIYNLANDPGTLTSGGDFGYFWLNTSSQKTLKWWDGANVRSIVDSTNIGSYTSGLATDLAGGAGGYLPYQVGTNDTTFLPLGTAAQILAVNSGLTGPEWINQSSMSVGSATTATTANAVANALTAGSYLTSTGTYNGSAARTFAVDATDANTASKVVARDASGDFAARNITANKILGLATITSGDADSTAATKGYVDSVAQGLDVKASCKAATVSNINLASPGATIDTVSLSVDNRVLVKDQSAPAENGIYLWKGAAVAMVRSPDADTWDDLVGAFTFIEEGTAANADSGWVCTVNAGGTLGSTAVTWVKFSQAGSYTPGNGIVQSGTSFNFAQSAAYTAGQIPFASSTSAIGFSSNLFWDNSNNRLGIGTATPASALDVVGTGIISQNLGIGAAPSYKLHVTQGDLNSYVVFQNNQTLAQYRSMQMVLGNGPSVFGANNRDWRVLNVASSATASDFVVDYWTGTAISEKFKIASDGVCTWSNVGGVAGPAMTLNATGLGVGVAPAVGYKISTNGNVGLQYGSELRLINTDNSSAYAIKSVGTGGGISLYFTLPGIGDRMVLDYNGNLGIGTTTPVTKLTIVNGYAGWGGAALTGNGAVIAVAGGRDSTIRIDGGVYGDGVCTANLHLSNSTGAGYNASNTGFRVQSNYNGSTGVGYFTIDSSSYTGTAYAYSERLRIDGSGNLGVGVTPSFRLDVKTATDGNHIRVSGAGQNAITFGNNTSTAGQGFLLGRSVSSDNANNFFLYDLTSGNTRLLIDSSGNCGIGTTTPAYKLDVNGSINATTTAGISITSSSNSTLTFKSAGSATPFYYFLDSSRNLIWQDNATERMTLSSSGNLGLGVTPNTWAAVFKAIQFPDGYAAIAGDNGNGVAEITSNAYNDGSWKFRNAQGAVRYRLDAINKTHTWFNTSTTPTANGAITWTQAMTLFSTGALSLGTASDALGQTGNVYLHGDSGSGKGAAVAFGQAGVVTGGIGQLSRLIGFGTSQDIVIQSQGSSNSVGINANPSGAVIYFQTQGSERLRIKSTGQVNFVGLASDPAGAAGDVYYNSTSNRLKYHNGTAWVNTGTNKYSGALAGTGTSFTVTHNLGTRDVTVAVRKSGSTYDQVFTDVQMTTDNTVTIIFASSVTGSDYTVTVIG